MSEERKAIWKVAFLSAKANGVPWASCGSKARVQYLKDAKEKLAHEESVESEEKDDVLADIEAFFKQR